MKYLPLVVGFLALTPCLASAQNQQFSDCRTLAVAGNFIGADEALVDGLVCKVGKPKTTAPASRPAAAKAPEGSEALLGIMEPEILRSKEKATANPGVREATPGPAPGSLPHDSGPGEAVLSSLVGHPPESLGEIASGFRKDAAVEATGNPDKGGLNGKTPDGKEVGRVAMVSQTDKAPTPLPVNDPRPAPTDASSLPDPAASRTQVGNRAERSETLAVPEAPPSLTGQERSPGAPREEPAAKHETGFQAMGGKASSGPALEAPSQAATPASRPTATNERIATGPASGRTLDAPKPERLATPEVFVSPRPVETEFRGEPQADSLEEDSLFREGQASNCNKNVSLGSMDKDKLFLAIPEWALKWYEKNQKRFPRICLSDSLMPGAKNYLVVFYTVPPDASATESLAKVSSPGETAGRRGMGSFTASYGSTWHYTYERTVTTTILSVSAEKAPHNRPSTLLDAMAYSDEGIPVTHHSRTLVAKRAKGTSGKAGKRSDVDLQEFRAMEELLSQMMEDIARQ